MKYRIILIFFLLFPSVSRSRAQYYDTGEDPASLRWLQIKTGKFTLIYPESYAGEAGNFARSLESSFSKLSAFYKVKKTNFPVVIHNYTTFSNGYVAWAPKRMEIYPTPEQNSIPLNHIEQLTIHELSHIMQMYSLKKGFTGLMTGLLGEQATALVSGLIPMWVLEGDAVLAESALTPSGRGRAPSFQKQLKAIVAEKEKNISYDKMLLGSYKDYLPDHYQFGYQVVAWGYSKHNHQIWNKALDYAARYPFTIYPVSISNMKNTGLSNSRLYSQTLDTLRAIWKKDISWDPTSYYKALNPLKGKDYISYFSPVVVGRDSIAAIKTSLFDPPSFVLLNISAGTEKRIHIPGDIYPWFLSGTKGKLAWVEQQPDPRWNNRDYSVVKIMSLKTGEVVQLSRNTRYMSASVSPDGRFVAVSENTADNKNALVILDAFNGQIINNIKTPDNSFIQRPCWSAEGDKITAITLTTDGEGIISYSVDMQTWKSLIEPGRNDLQSSFLRNDTLFYVSSSSGTDNIYLLTPEGKISMITNSKFGAYDLSPDKNRIYFSDYSASGNNITSTLISYAFSPVGPALQKESFLINRFDTLSDKQAQPAQISFEPKPYKKWMHPFRFHSWMPFYADVEELQSDPTQIKPGITFLSQNTLSTLITSVGYEYTDNNHLIHSKLTWKGWLPVIESRLDYGGNSNIYKLSDQVGDPEVILPGLRFTNSISIPLSFSSGRFSQYLWSSFSASYQNNYIYLKETGMYDQGQTQMTVRLYFSNQHQSATRDIYPRWAQVLDLSSSFYPADKDLYGPLNSLRTAIYIPGLVRNHGMRFRFEADRQKPEKLILYNRASFPRGYHDIISQELNFLSADYVMPVIYPDLNIPGLLYLKRIRAGLFYDFAEGTDNRYLVLQEYHNYTEYFRSFGTELLADFNLLRIPFTISAGMQASWKKINEAPSIGLLFKIDVYGRRLGSKRL